MGNFTHVGHVIFCSGVPCRARDATGLTFQLNGQTGRMETHFLSGWTLNLLGKPFLCQITVQTFCWPIHSGSEVLPGFIWGDSKAYRYVNGIFSAARVKPTLCSMKAQGTIFLG